MNTENDDASPELLAAMDALEAGHLEEALVEAAHIKEAPDRAFVEAQAYIGLGMHAAAEGALERLTDEVGNDEPMVQELFVELHLARWEFDEALAVLEGGEAAADDEAWAFMTMALIADHQGQRERSVDLQQRAHDLDPEGSPPPVALSDAAFDAIVDKTLAELPQTFRQAIEGTRIVREPLPFRELGAPGAGTGLLPPDILGLFNGPTIHDGLGQWTGQHPPSIYLFKTNIERVAWSENEVQEEVKTTLMHEIGHLMGLDEDEVAAMGLA